ncbi:MAG: type I secretion system permease/ATPase [Rhodoferax sp.]|nr:type I secretion system permease/ATPase [Rhodoferax sp.]
MRIRPISERAAQSLAVEISARTAVDTPLGKIFAQCKQTFYLVVALTYTLEFLSLAPLLYLLNVYDRVLSSRSGITLVSLTVIIVAVYVFWGAMEWIRQRLMVRLSLRIDWDVGPDVFDASFRSHALNKNVDVHQLLGDLMDLRQFFTGAPLLALIQAPFAIVFIAIGWLFHPYLAILAAAASVLILFFTYMTLKVSGPIMREAQQAKSQANRVAADSLRHAETTLAMGMLGAVRDRWYEQHSQFLTKQVYASEASGLMGGFTGFITRAMPSLQIGLGVYLAMEGLITGGMVIVASMLVSKAMGPMNALLSNWRAIATARQAYDRVNALLLEDEVYQSQMELPEPKGELLVSDLVGLPPGAKKPVLSGISFNLGVGQVMAVVGPSAAGKSSLVKLLLGLWAPASGSVRLDGVELCDWSHDEVGPHIGYVPQEIEFFDGTVSENIARLGPVDPEKVVHAAELIGMHQIILGFPQGYDTPLGESGFALSGGQRQRLAIARAVYGSPKYVVMDEPNSNLDDAGEAALVQTISKLKEMNTTVIITTHRPRLVGAVDMMLVLKAGKQIAFGPAKSILDTVRQQQGGTQAIGRNLAAVPAAPASPGPAIAATGVAT